MNLRQAGIGEALTALQGKHVGVFCGDLAEVMQAVKAGAQVRLLAVLADQRLPGLLPPLSDEEALASEDSSDEDVSMVDDAYDDSFVDDAIQIDNVDMESVYLRSLLVEKKVEPPRRLPTSVFSQTPPYEVWMNRCLRSDQLR